MRIRIRGKVCFVRMRVTALDDGCRAYAVPEITLESVGRGFDLGRALVSGAESVIR